jgi:hypothetical protein
MKTIIDFLKRFFVDLFYGLYFSAIEYDNRLKLTKTFTQRLIIWSIITVVSSILIFLVILSIWRFIDSVNASSLEFGN